MKSSIQLCWIFVTCHYYCSDELPECSESISSFSRLADEEADIVPAKVNIKTWMKICDFANLKTGVFLSRKSEARSTITGNSVSSSNSCLQDFMLDQETQRKLQFDGCCANKGEKQKARDTSRQLQSGNLSRRQSSAASGTWDHEISKSIDIMTWKREKRF